MKKILITLLSLVSLVSYSQKIPCIEYPLYSDIWTHECGTNGIQKLLPKDNKSFSLTNSYFVDNVDERKVESYLLESLNEFRADYGKGPVKESKWLTKISEIYAKKLSNSTFKHDKLKKFGVDMMENIAGYMALTFSHLTVEDGDLNKIIADAYFDIYVSSKHHMEMLLCDNEYFGFGLVIKESGKMYGVVRCSSKSKNK